MQVRKSLQRIISSELNRKIITHSSWILGGTVVSKFTLLIATILMAHYLGKEEYGQFGIIKSTILMFVMFAGMELGLTATKYISQYKTTDKTKIERIIGLSNFFAITVSIFISSLIFIFSKEIANQIKAPALSYEIKISAFILFFSSLNGIQSGILAGLENFKAISINNSISGVCSAIALIFASKYLNLDAVVIAFGAGFVMLYILNFLTLKKEFYNQFTVRWFDRANFKEIKVIYKFSFPAILAGVMIGPVLWFCNYLVVRQPMGYFAMANFDIANQWRTTILFIPAAIAQIALPLLSSKVEDKDGYKAVYRKNLKVTAYIAGIFVIGFVLVTPLIVSFYGTKYENVFWPLIIMFLSAGFSALNGVIGQALASQGKMWLGFNVNLVWAIVLITGCYVFVVQYQFGAIGLCIAYLISYIVHTLIQFLYIRRLIL